MAPTTRTHVAPTETTDTKTRSFSMSIDINATPEDVWRALTDAGELMRWLPLQARVTPGKGGSVFWGMGPVRRDEFHGRAIRKLDRRVLDAV